MQTKRASAGETYDGLDGRFGKLKIQINGRPTVSADSQ